MNRVVFWGNERARVQRGHVHVIRRRERRVTWVLFTLIAVSAANAALHVFGLAEGVSSPWVSIAHGLLSGVWLGAVGAFVLAIRNPRDLIQKDMELYDAGVLHGRLQAKESLEGRRFPRRCRTCGALQVQEDA